MELRHPSDTLAAGSIDRNDRLSTDLELIRNVNDAGVDRARGRICFVPHVCGCDEISYRRLKICLDQRNHPVEHVWEAKIDDVRLQIWHAELDRSAILQEMRMSLFVKIDLARIEVD